MNRTKSRLNNVFRSREDELYANLRSIFAGGRNGYVYDSDADELNQLSTGTTPVTAVTNPVGLQLDKRVGLALGPELVDTMNTIAAWTASGTNTVEQDGDAVKITYVDNAAGAVALLSAAAGLTSNLTVGANYKVTYQVKVNSGSCNAAMVNAATNQSVAITSTTYITQEFLFNASSVDANSFTFANLSAGEIVWIRAISIRLFEGNHSIQATAAARPTWSNRVNLLNFSEDLTNAVWLKTVVGTGVLPVITNNYGIAPDGSQTATRVQLDLGATPATAVSRVLQSVTTSSTSNIDGIWAKTVDGSTKTVELGSLGKTVTGTWTFFTEAATTEMNIRLRGAQGTSNTADILVWHPQLELGTVATRYQRTVSATEFDTVGFPYYISTLGVDDCMTSATGGGGSAGFFWCGAILPTGGAGTDRDLFEDRGTNTGYTVEISAANKLALIAGNGAALTTLASTATVNVGTKYLLSVWDDGANLNVQINNGVVESVARPVVSAGTTGFTRFKSNAAASDFFIGYEYASVYFRDTAGTAAERANAQNFCKLLAGL